MVTQWNSRIVRDVIATSKSPYSIHFQLQTQEVINNFFSTDAEQVNVTVSLVYASVNQMSLVKSVTAAHLTTTDTILVVDADPATVLTRLKEANATITLDNVDAVQELLVVIASVAHQDSGIMVRVVANLATVTKSSLSESAVTQRMVNALVYQEL